MEIGASPAKIASGAVCIENRDRGAGCHVSKRATEWVVSEDVTPAGPVTFHVIGWVLVRWDRVARVGGQVDKGGLEWV